MTVDVLDHGLMRYPPLGTQDKVYEFTQAERDFDLVFSAIKASRALAASYNIQQGLHGSSYTPVCI